MVQANLVASFLRTAGYSVTIKPIVTSGDEIEEALLAKQIDLGVHRMKDLPATLPRGCSIVAVTKREDPRDAMVSSVARTLAELPAGARVGTSSPRRRAQILDERGDIDIVPVSGDVEARLQTLKNGEVEAIVVAAAGLKRLRIAKVITQYLPPERFVPAVGQGALAVEARRGEKELSTIVQRLCHHQDTATAIRAERSFLKRIGGDRLTPMGAHAVITGSRLVVVGFLARPDGTHPLRERIEGDVPSAADLGKRLADEMTAMLSGRSIGRRV